MDLRKATCSDTATIAHIHVASWRSAYRDILDPAYLSGPIEADRLNVWQERLRNSSASQLVLLGESDGQAVAFACTFAGEDSEWGALLDNIHVMPGAKRKGLGRKLLGSTAEWLAREFPLQPLHLWVFEANESAQKFYDAMGGKVVERRAEPKPGGGEAPGLRYFWPDPTILVC